MNFRLHKWTDIRDMSAVYGIQAQKGKGRRWKHCHVDGKPMFYKDEGEALTEMAKLVHREIA